MNFFTKKIFAVLGFISLGLGVIGAFLPLLPTTPFALLAAYFFSRSSDKLHSWLLSLPKIGPVIKDWDQYGAIARKTKVIALSTLIPLISYTIFLTDRPIAIKVLMAIIMVSVSLFIVTRPEKREQRK